ncbi:hypothetical protein ABN028_05170 [Actinopolymorpha sp. B17G11]|uniref:hypothetical protein n=1 Tax=Actinopolymorpha sp. B17G11 TaxID=3160861 RepID=UPI0032E49868
MATARQRSGRSGLLRSFAHPLAPGLGIALGAIGVATWQAVADPPGALSWVVVALAAGYSISGSV